MVSMSCTSKTLDVFNGFQQVKKTKDPFLWVVLQNHKMYLMVSVICTSKPFLNLCRVHKDFLMHHNRCPRKASRKKLISTRLAHHSSVTLFNNCYQKSINSNIFYNVTMTVLLNLIIVVMSLAAIPLCLHFYWNAKFLVKLYFWSLNYLGSIALVS